MGKAGIKEGKGCMRRGNGGGVGEMTCLSVRSVCLFFFLTGWAVSELGQDDTRDRDETGKGAGSVRSGSEGAVTAPER